MIKIENEKIEQIASDYLAYLRVFLPRKRKFKVWCKENPSFDKYFKTLEKYVLLPPKELQAHKLDFADCDNFKNIMTDLYKCVQQKYGVTLLNQLDIKTCPYCNLSYTYATVSGKKRRPQLDHFYSKTKYPALSLSFYNLIPSCPYCNFAKGDKDIGVNPYTRGFGENAIFTIKNIENLCFENSSKEGWDILIETKDEDIASNIKQLELSVSYAEHKDYVEELIFKKRAYSSGYYELIRKFFETSLDKRAGLDIELLIVGNYLNEDKHSLRPLSKLTADIWKKYE